MGALLWRYFTPNYRILFMRLPWVRAEGLKQENHISLKKIALISVGFLLIAMVGQQL